MMKSEFETMVFFSLHYPFHFTDSYLDEEINLLAKKFDKLIIISSNTFSADKREVPPNAVVFRFSPNPSTDSRIQSLLLLFHPVFYKKIFQIFFDSEVRLSVPVFKELFAFYSRAIATENFLEQVLQEQKVNRESLLIYTYWMVESTMAAVMVKNENPSVKVISRAHSQDVYFDRSPVLFHPFRKYIFNHLEHLFFISANARNYFIKKHSLTTAEIQKTSISRIGITGTETNYLPQRADNIFRIISVAYIQKIKRVDLIIDALALVKDVQIEWIHAGHSNQSEKEFEEIKNYAAQKFSSTPNISFSFLGKTSKEDLFKLYTGKKFDCFLNVSETEGIPVSMMEAMSYSVPVIGTNVGGVSEIVEDNLNGFLLSAYPDAKETADVISNFLNLSNAEKNKFRENAFATWKEKYNAQKNYKEFSEQVFKIIE